MRVTIASRIFAPEPAAAAYRLSALADALVRDGHDVTVLTSAVPSRAKKAAAALDERSGARIRRAPVFRDKAGYVRGYLQYLSFDIPLFVRLLFARASDVIVTEPPPTTGFVVRVAAGLRRTPYVYYAADVWSDAAESTGAPAPVVGFVRWLERRALHAARQVIAVTDGVAARVRELAHHDRVKIVRNGIDTAVFTPDGPVIDGPPTAVYAGTTSEWQGADIFIRAMPQVREAVPDARLVFIGQGSAWHELQRIAAEVAPGAIGFHGLVPPAKAATWLRSARAGLVSLKPGQGYDFAFPTKVYASIACGTPVVYAGRGPGRDYIDAGRFGRAVDYAVDEVVAAVSELLRVPVTSDERSRLHAAAVHDADIASVGAKAADVVVASAGDPSEAAR
jgi:Glycosyltransferase